MSGGYDYEPVEDVKQDFYCVICLNLLKDAMQLECQHGMCNFCLQSLARSSKQRNVEFTCPSCRTPIDENKVHPVGMINRVILSLKVKCVNTRAGCDWCGEVSNMKDHQNNTCEFQNVVCDSNGCSFKARKFEMTCHKKSCNFRMVLCDYCQENNVYNDIPAHLRTCPCYPLICSNACGESIPRKDMISHLQDRCPLRLVDCTFKQAGCDIVVTASEINNHVSNALHDHLNLVFKHSLEMKLVIELSQKEATDAKHQLAETQNRLDATQKEFKVMQENLSAIKTEATDAKHQLAETQNRLDATQKEFKVMQENLSATKMEAADAKHQLAETQNRLDATQKEFKVMQENLSAIKIEAKYAKHQLETQNRLDATQTKSKVMQENLSATKREI
ncbi:TNF receptor-associated factor 3-like isoform X2 [Hydractinia symbiolongicarpus]|uniref:TNF receptor-associated factor 3-like isoform X2 n=1 Tax=Hydractinia symbiolongicarpus TaxID=13093 RepID=UPI00254F512C|nr:TNF receptor-associated factor 3-like isoform X2 [Hydractinia symbiolongicarpus]